MDRMFNRTQKNECDNKNFLDGFFNTTITSKARFFIFYRSYNTIKKERTEI